MFRNIPLIDQMVMLVSQAIALRGLRVTIYHPSHTAVTSAAKFITKVISGNPTVIPPNPFNFSLE
jgi:hypothetical protein